MGATGALGSEFKYHMFATISTRKLFQCRKIIALELIFIKTNKVNS